VTSIYFRGLRADLPGGQGEFLTFKQYNLEGGKVGEGWKGKGERFGKWVEPADLPTPHLYAFASRGGATGGLWGGGL